MIAALYCVAAVFAVHTGAAFGAGDLPHAGLFAAACALFFVAAVAITRIRR